MRALISRPGSTIPVMIECEAPAPGPGEVAIRTTAATVNPIDVLVANGMAREAFGLAGDVGLGWDLAGTVQEVGAGVSDFQAGDRVAALNANPSDRLRAQSEVVVVPQSAVAHIPATLSDVDAASLAMNAPTAAIMVDLLGAGEGKTLLVTGAAGAVGGFLLPLARNAGWQVSGLARETDREFVTSAGAELITQLPSAQFDALADAATMQQAAIGAVKDGGKFVGVVPGALVPSERGIDVSAVLVEQDGARLAKLLAKAADGELAARVAGQISFDDYLRAYGMVAEPSGRRGRVVLTF